MNIDNNIAMKELAEHFRQEQPHLMRYACYRLGYPDDAKDALQDVFLKNSEKLSDEKNAEVIDCATISSVHSLTCAPHGLLHQENSGQYAGTYVFYTLTLPDRKQEQKHIAVRNDNEKHIWIVDGGL
jgi:hypothetical protein